jgi:hypothetical protein
MAIRIIGIRKPGGAQNTHQAISHYLCVEDGSRDSNLTPRLTAVGWVESGIELYVHHGGRTVLCYVRISSSGTKFLQTVTDGQWTDNLLSLPEV